MATFATIEHKVSHREWDEAGIPAADFFDNLPQIIGEAVTLGLIDLDGGIDDLIRCPTLIFEKGSVGVDEMWGVRGRTVWSSSGPSGIVEWNVEQQGYTRCFYGSERPLGGLLSIEFTLTDELRPLFTEQVPA